MSNTLDLYPDGFASGRTNRPVSSADGGRTFQNVSSNATFFSDFAFHTDAQGHKVAHDFGTGLVYVHSPNITEVTFNDTSIWKFQGENLTWQNGPIITFKGLPHPVCGHGTDDWISPHASGHIQLADGTHLHSTIIEWCDAPYPYGVASLVAFQSSNGIDYEYVGNVITSLDVPESTEGPNEHDMALLGNGDVLCVARMGAGDGKGGYMPLYKTLSKDGGKSWSAAEAMPKIGCARPHLVQLDDNITLLSAGRSMMKDAYSRSFSVWMSIDHGVTWARSDGSYHHNDKAEITGAPTWPASCNKTGWRFEFTSGYVGLVRVGPRSAMVLYDFMPPVVPPPNPNPTPPGKCKIHIHHTIGCYNDSDWHSGSKGLLLPAYESTVHGKISLETCASACHAAKLSVAGVNAGSDCFCGVAADLNTPGAIARNRPKAECMASVCDADPREQECGGPGRMLAYHFTCDLPAEGVDAPKALFDQHNPAYSFAMRIDVVTGCGNCSTRPSIRPGAAPREIISVIGDTPLAVTYEGSCTSDLSCSLNGRCSSGECDCDVGFTGRRCELFDFLPTPPASGFHSPAMESNLSAWGGTAVFDPLSHLWHGYFSEFFGGCGVLSWESQSQIVHAVSHDPIGPFIKHDVSIGAEAHNAEARRDPASGELLLFHIGSGDNAGHTTHGIKCTNGSTSSCIRCADAPFWRTEGRNFPWRCCRNITTNFPRGSAQAGTSILHHSKSLTGPWVPLRGNLSLSNLQPRYCRDNPTSYIAKNGTIYVLAVCHLPTSTQDAHPGSEEGLPSILMLWRAESWTDDFRQVGNITRSNANGERQWSWVDPTLWVDARGNVHVVANMGYDGYNCRPIGAHAFSADGGKTFHSFCTGADPANLHPIYNGSTQFVGSEGTRWLHLERPKIIIDPNTGSPAAMFASVGSHCPNVSSDRSWTIARPIRTASPSPPFADAKCTWVTDTDYVTMNIGNVGVNLTKQQCCNICKRHADCTFAVFGTPTEKIPRSCWLKTGAAQHDRYVYSKGATTCCPYGMVCPKAKPPGA